MGFKLKHDKELSPEANQKEVSELVLAYCKDYDPQSLELVYAQLGAYSRSDLQLPTALLASLKPYLLDLDPQDSDLDPATTVRLHENKKLYEKLESLCTKVEPLSFAQIYSSSVAHGAPIVKTEKTKGAALNKRLLPKNLASWNLIAFSALLTGLVFAFLNGTITLLVGSCVATGVLLGYHLMLAINDRGGWRASLGFQEALSTWGVGSLGRWLLMPILGSVTVASALVSGAALMAARAAIRLLRSFVANDELVVPEDEARQTAIDAGKNSQSWSGYATSFFVLNAWRDYAAFATGMVSEQEKEEGKRDLKSLNTDQKLQGASLTR